jgi:hypothetical protein
MAGGEAIGAELAGEAEQVGELDALVARDARDRRAPTYIFAANRSITPSRKRLS